MLKAQVDDLAKCLAKFVKGTKNLNMIDLKEILMIRQGLALQSKKKRSNLSLRKPLKRIPHTLHYALTVTLRDIIS